MYVVATHSYRSLCHLNKCKTKCAKKFNCANFQTLLRLYHWYIHHSVMYITCKSNLWGFVKTLEFFLTMFLPKKMLSKDVVHDDYQKQCAQIRQIQLGICK